MRLGAYPCVLDTSSKSFAAYGQKEISERHRHRYEFNNDFAKEIEKAGADALELRPTCSAIRLLPIRTVRDPSCKMDSLNKRRYMELSYGKRLGIT